MKKGEIAQEGRMYTHNNFAHLNAVGTEPEAHSAGPKAYSVGPKAHGQGRMMILNMYSYITYSGRGKGLPLD